MTAINFTEMYKQEKRRLRKKKPQQTIKFELPGVPSDLGQYRINSSLQEIYYIPQFLSEADEQIICSCVSYFVSLNYKI